MFSKLIRRIHMYLALALSPWILMYAFSTFAMNHREWFLTQPGGNAASWEKMDERMLGAPFPPGTSPDVIARRVLTDLGWDGGYTVNARPDRITIIRSAPFSPKRITYTPADGKLLIETQHLTAARFLANLHVRRGFQSAYAMNDAWALSVDATVAGIFFWILSGVWMWWELRVTRRLGAIFAAAGFGLFAILFFAV